MNDATVPADLSFTMMRAALTEGCRAFVAAQDIRRALMRAHLKALDDEVRSGKTMLSRVTTATDQAALQGIFAQLMSDRLEHQSALAREYGRAFADGWSAWLEGCRTAGAPWAVPGEESGKPASGMPMGMGMDGLSKALGNFYEQMGRMSSMLAASVPPAGGGNGTARQRTSA